MKKILWGLFLILLGIAALLTTTGKFPIPFSQYWPAAVILLGIFCEIDGLASLKHGDGTNLVFAFVFLSAGILFLVCTLNLTGEGWGTLKTFWPVFLLGPGLGFLQYYIFSKNHPIGILIPAVILLAVGGAFLAQNYTEINAQILFPLLIIGAGIIVLLSSFGRKKG